MPRLAPVSSMTRRGELLEDGMEYPFDRGGPYRGEPAMARGRLVLGRGLRRRPEAFRSRIEPLLAPALSVAVENHPVVQPERSVLPEFQRNRRDAETCPVRRAGNFADRELGRVDRDGLFQREAAFEGARLLARPGADAAVAGAAAEIGVRFLLGHQGHRAA